MEYTEEQLKLIQEKRLELNKGETYIDTVVVEFLKEYESLIKLARVNNLKINKW